MAGKVHKINCLFTRPIATCVSLDYLEEQEGELETLRCIYSEQELTEVSNTPPCFKISVQATDSSDDKDVTGTHVDPPICDY